jgi:hypothetical protein
MTGYLWIFAIFDCGVLVLILCEMTASPSRAYRRSHCTGAASVIAVVALLASYAMQLALTAYVAAHQAPPPPLPAFAPAPPISGAIPAFDAVAALALVIGGMQTALLLFLYRNPPGWRAIVVGGAVLALMAWASPVLYSGDVYAYIGDGLLGLAAYAPPSVPFHGDLTAINAWWGVPIPRTVYGPLWIGTVAIVTAPFATLFGKFVALRTLGALTVAGLLLVLRALRVPRRILAVAALNPALYFAYVTNAHNDLFGMVIILCATLVIRDRPAFAFALMTAGALVKLPFALFALPLVAEIRSIPLRVAFCIGVPAVAAAVTLWAGGSGFVVAATPHVLTSGLAAWCTVAIGIAALAATGVAAAGGRRLRAAVWLMPLATAFACSWYLAWSLPYAVARHRILGYFLVGFPLAAAVIDVKLMRPWTIFIVVPAVVAWQAFALRGTPEKVAA